MHLRSRSLLVAPLLVLSVLLRGCADDGTNTGNARGDCPIYQVPPGELPGRAEGRGCKWGVGLKLEGPRGAHISGSVAVNSTGLLEPPGDECRSAIVGSGVSTGFTVDLSWGLTEDFVDENGALRAHWEHELGEHIIAVRPQIRVGNDRYAFIRAMDLTITSVAEVTVILQVARQFDDGGIEEFELGIAGPVFVESPRSRTVDVPHGYRRYGEHRVRTGTGEHPRFSVR